MEISGVSLANTPALNVDNGSFSPSNTNTALSPEFVSAANQFGQDEIARGAAPQGANPFDIFLQALAPSLVTMVNISGYDFNTEAE